MITLLLLFRAQKRFTELLNREDRNLQNARIPMERICTLPELKVKRYFLVKQMKQSSSCSQYIIADQANCCGGSGWCIFILNWPLYLIRFQSNPFQDRICQVFSTSEQNDGSLTFEDFLDLLSAFSDSATLEIKSHYAFRIFGK